jgi:hypothetical protein
MVSVCTGAGRLQCCFKRRGEREHAEQMGEKELRFNQSTSVVAAVSLFSLLAEDDDIVLDGRGCRIVCCGHRNEERDRQHRSQGLVPVILTEQSHVQVEKS